MPAFNNQGEERVSGASGAPLGSSPKDPIQPRLDYEMAVSMGVVKDHSKVHKFGANPNIGSATPETVWDVGGTVAFNSSNQSMEILGGANDDAGGTGALTVTVFGQNLAGTEQTETLTMAGTTPVALADTYTHIYRAFVATAGSGETNDADIVIRIASAGATQATILAGNGQTMMAIYRIPVGKTGYLTRWDARVVKKIAATCEFTLWQRPDGGAWRIVDVMAANSVGTTGPYLTYSPPQSFAALTELYVQADSDTNNTGVGSSFDIILVST